MTTSNFILTKEKTGLLIIDVQEQAFGEMERPCEVLYSMQQMIKGAKLLGLPIFATEHTSENAGSTIQPIKDLLGKSQHYWKKSKFSCMSDPTIKKSISEGSVSQWIVIGIEAHICVLQSAKGLLNAGMEVVVLNDAITSGSIYDFSTAIAELRDIGVRVSNWKTVLFELMKDSNDSSYDEIVSLTKE